MDQNKDESSKIKILLAEDDKFISMAYQAGLENAGLRVLIASDGDEALSVLKKEGADLILLDLMMPKKNGFEFLEITSIDEKFKKIPVIVLSNLGQESDIKKCKELGAVDYLIKANFSMQEVIDRVKTYLPK